MSSLCDGKIALTEFISSPNNIWLVILGYMIPLSRKFLTWFEFEGASGIIIGNRCGEPSTLNKFPDFFRVGTFIDSTHMKL